uniref:Ig-like domain-containing protein n=1 Tax=Seriola lalandi dorsalis TaxID=1841481 RepID=A0A3B4YCE0_SERLL
THSHLVSNCHITTKNTSCMIIFSFINIIETDIGEFMVTLPKTIEVLKGSCVTIPCSFEIPRRFQNNLDNTCKTIWKNKDEVIFTSDNPNLITTKEMTGDLTRKNCTTTFNNMRLDHTNDYYFRLQCDNQLKWNFHDASVNIIVKADPPSPTLTPSTLEETEGTSVRLKCSAPAPCLSQPPTLTWTPGLGDSQETLQENQDKTKVMTSVLTFTASHLHHGKTISCTATYNKQDGSPLSSAHSVLTADISYTPKSTTVSVRPSGPVPEDTNVTLTCTSDAKPAVRNYTWYRADGGQETFIGTGQTLNITASKLTAAFICMAENLLGTGRSNISQIDVQCMAYCVNAKFYKMPYIQICFLAVLHLFDSLANNILFHRLFLTFASLFKLF